MAGEKTGKMKYTVETSDSGVSFVYYIGKPFCAIHHLQAGGVENAKRRAELIADLLNKQEV